MVYITNSIISEAAKKGHLKIVKFALDNLDPLQILEQETHTLALNSAIKGSHLSTVTLLLERGVSPHPQGRDLNPLGTVITKGHLEITRLLIGYGAVVNPSKARLQRLQEPFAMAVKEGRVELVRLLLENGMVVSEQREKTLFFVAKRLGWEKIAGEFERFGVGVNRAVRWERVGVRLRPLYE